MNHERKVKQLQNQLKNISAPISLRYSGSSNTTRSKAYKKSSRPLDFSHFNEIIQIDTEKRIARVEPRVTMEELLQATLAVGLIPPVVPEFKGITVGGAIMGGSAESSSHIWGGFHDTCLSCDILCGDGTLLHASPQENADIFYGIHGSYGSLGALVAAEIQLVPATEYVHLRYYSFNDPLNALSKIQELSYDSNPPDYIDGIVFSGESAVVIEGRRSNTANEPKVSLTSFHSPWYFQHAKNAKEEWMPLADYLFRYDQGAFWMGAYLFRLPLLARFFAQGICKIGSRKLENFTPEQVKEYHQIPEPGAFWRTVTFPIMNSQTLWKLLHMAEKWIQDRMIIQDFCIPEDNAEEFLNDALEDPGTFPIWLCPIKGTNKPQILAPHLLRNNQPSHFINVGIYGLPSYFDPLEEITRKLEKITHAYGGRKVLYSRSYYTPEEFWKIYPKDVYETLRKKTHAEGVWQGITEKVLSV